LRWASAAFLPLKTTATFSILSAFARIPNMGQPGASSWVACPSRAGCPSLSRRLGRNRASEPQNRKKSREMPEECSWLAVSQIWRIRFHWTYTGCSIVI
jgi:hypothetical protein